MQYEAYIRPVEGADTAVLMIHGIVGSPAHFKDLLPVIPENWSVYNILLDGHGHGVEEFARTSMEKWKAQVSRVLEEILASHSQVFIVAHSMGTLFAIDEAIKHPDKVRSLLLLAVPLTPWTSPAAMAGSLAAALGRVKPGSAAERMLQDSGVHLTPKLWKYIAWLPRFWELILEAHRTKKKLPQITVPCCAFQSRRDELVSHGAARILGKHPNITTAVLPNSGHFHYSKEDLALLQSALKEMIDTI